MNNLTTAGGGYYDPNLAGQIAAMSRAAETLKGNQTFQAPTSGPGITPGSAMKAPSGQTIAYSQFNSPSTPKTDVAQYAEMAKQQGVTQTPTAPTANQTTPSTTFNPVASAPSDYKLTAGSAVKPGGINSMYFGTAGLNPDGTASPERIQTALYNVAHGLANQWDIAIANQAKSSGWGYDQVSGDATQVGATGQTAVPVTQSYNGTDTTAPPTPPALPDQTALSEQLKAMNATATSNAPTSTTGNVNLSGIQTEEGAFKKHLAELSAPSAEETSVEQQISDINQQEATLTNQPLLDQMAALKAQTEAELRGEIAGSIAGDQAVRAKMNAVNALTSQYQLAQLEAKSGTLKDRLTRLQSQRKSAMDVEKANLDLAENAYARQYAENKDAQARLQQQFDNSMKLINQQATQANLTRDDARATVSTLLSTFGSKAFDNVTPDALKALEVKAGFPEGALKDGIKTLKEVQAESKTKPELREVNGSLYSISQDPKTGQYKTTLLVAKSTGSGSTLQNSATYNKTKSALDASRGSDGYVNTDKYKELRSGLKAADQATFDLNFSWMLNPNDPSAQDIANQTEKKTTGKVETNTDQTFNKILNSISGTSTKDIPK